MHSIIKKNNLLIISILVLLLIQISCSSRDQEGIDSDDKIKGTFLTFNIAGIEEIGNTTNAAISSIQKSKMIETQNIERKKIVSLGQGLDIIINAEEQVKTLGIQKEASSLPITTVATSSLMPIGRKYRLLIYDTNTNALIKDVPATAGTNPNINVDAGKQYKWYAISFNSGTTPVVANNTISSTQVANRDVLYASGVINTVYGQNNLEITFKHLLSVINIVVDSRALFGTINNTTTIELGTDAGTGFNNIVKTGDFNILTGEFTNIQDVPAITAAQMTNRSTAMGVVGSTKIGSLFTVNTQSISTNSLRLKINKLDITMTDPLTNSQNNIRSWSNLIVPMKNTAFTFTKGHAYVVTSILIESGIQVGNNLWARTNLYYDVNAQDDKWRFRADNGGYNGSDQALANTDFWNYRSATPAGIYSDGIDPCTKVYPNGVWRMPSNADFQDLQNGPDPSPGLGGFLITTGGISFGTARRSNTLGGDASYPLASGTLNFIFNGYRTNDGQIKEASNTLVSDEEPIGSVSYWTSSNLNSSEINNGSYFYQSYLRDNARLSLPSFKTGSMTEGRQIRCVRNVAYN